MRIRPLYAIVPLILLQATEARTQGLEVFPDTVVDLLRPSVRAFDTVSLANKTAGALRVDSITIRLLDGGANPKPSDFIACNTCPPDSINAYLYRGWMYGGWLFGDSGSQTLRYLQDSLFLIQDGQGLPVTVSLAPGASAPFSLAYPVNCPACSRMPSYPGATRYAFTFIASEGSRSVLIVEANPPTAMIRRKPRLQRAGPGFARDAAGRWNSGSRGAILFPNLSD